MRLVYCGEENQDRCADCNEYIVPWTFFKFIGGRNFWHEKCAWIYEYNKKTQEEDNVFCGDHIQLGE